MTPDPQLVAIANTAADLHKLDRSLVCAIVEQESSWEPKAVRYEPAFYRLYIVPLKLADLAEAEGRAYSYGLMQIMGETAREHGFSGKFVDLLDAATGLLWGCVHFKSLLDRESNDVYNALQHWNGGGNKLYAGQVIARINKYLPQQQAPNLEMLES